MALIGLVFLYSGILSVELVALYFTIIDFIEEKAEMTSFDKKRFLGGALGAIYTNRHPK